MVERDGQGGLPGPGDYRDEVELELLGRRVRLLELSREISMTMPIYPGHVKVAFWDHLTHEEVRRLRLPPDSPFRGYSVKGIVMCDHVSTHVDAVWHFNPDRPDLTIDRLPWEHLITPAAWIDLSAVWPERHVTVAHVQQALDGAGVTLRPGMTLLYYTGAAELCTDAASTDTPSDLAYPNHRTHAEHCVIHTEIVANIERIPMHHGFYVAFFPLRFVGGTGSPARAIALWEVEGESGAP
jgi:kynurenine formamidase